jgi:hypothetical protein
MSINTQTNPRSHRSHSLTTRFGSQLFSSVQLEFTNSTSIYNMYVIEILLKNTAMPMSVQRKTVEEATTVYQQVLAAMGSTERALLELSCDRQPEKKIAVMTDLIVAAQIYEKSGGAATGKTPGFASFAAAT